MGEGIITSCTRNLTHHMKSYISTRGLCCYTEIRWTEISTGIVGQNAIEINGVAHIYTEREFGPANALYGLLSELFYSF